MRDNQFLKVLESRGIIIGTDFRVVNRIFASFRAMDVIGIKTIHVLKFVKGTKNSTSLTATNEGLHTVSTATFQESKPLGTGKNISAKQSK